MDLNSKNIYGDRKIHYSILIKGQLYDENKTNIIIAMQVLISRKKNLQEEYNTCIWDAVTALSIDPREITKSCPSMRKCTYKRHVPKKDD